MARVWELFFRFGRCVASIPVVRMSSIELPRRDLLWWIVPLAGLSVAMAVRTLLEGDAVHEGFINPWLLGAAAAALCAAGLWFEQVWARWVGLALAAALVVAAGWKFAQDFAVWRIAAIGAFIACAWLLWRLPLGRRDEDEPFVSLVLLFREPHYVDASILAQLASRAWEASVEVADDEEGPPDRAEDDDEPVRSVVGGAMPHFFCFHPPAFFTIHCFDEPYFDDPEDVAESVPELRAQQAIAQHKAWISVDLIHWMGEDDDRTEAYRLIGRLLAELADENCLAVLDPGEGRIFVYDPETERKLRSDNPLRELQEMYYAPIATIDGDDEQMKAAVAEAKRRWPEFIAAFEGRDNEENDFLIKAPFSHDEFTEFMWVKVTGIENRVVYGELGNEPANIPQLHEGDLVRVKEEDVNDWMCVLQGKPVGGFTLKVLGRSFEDE
jgi:uncharacterized protein YegJ (DUF2314 family)